MIGGDLDLQQASYDKHIWIGEKIEIPSDGGLKLRADHDWAVSSVAAIVYGTINKDNSPNLTEVIM